MNNLTIANPAEPLNAAAGFLATGYVVVGFCALPGWALKNSSLYYVDGVGRGAMRLCHWIASQARYDGGE
ncbi:MAG: hypothetical protein FWC66_09745 [Oscillospiraceae bacterium]|nr:hypothetical protein [Oscillospiraceae bacterium]